jgi:hypothetical protein
MKNMSIVSVLLLVCAALSLAGCAGQGTMITKMTMPDGSIQETSQPGSFMGPSSYDIGYQGMYNAHESSKAARAAAIMGVKAPDNPEAKAYAEAAKLMGVAMMSMERFDVKAPTTGFDVLNNAVNQVIPVSGFVALYRLGKSGIENAGNITLGDNATTTGSFNRTNTTTMSTGSSTNSTTVQPYEVKPDITTITPEDFTVNHF